MNEPTNPDYTQAALGQHTIVTYYEDGQSSVQRVRLALIIGWLKRLIALNPYYDTCYVCKYRSATKYLHIPDHTQSTAERPIRLCVTCFESKYDYPPLRKQ